MVVGSADVAVLRRIRQTAEADRGGTRPDIARELSLAITALEDAEMRLTRALVRAARHKADAEMALGTIGDQLVDESDLTTPDKAGEASDSNQKEVG